MKSFKNHVVNGVYLTFPNGNSISTIWGRGSYTENHDFTTGDVEADFSTRLESNDVEIMIDTSNAKLAKRIHNKLAPTSDDSVIEHLNISQWLWVLNQLEKGT